MMFVAMIYWIMGIMMGWILHRLYVKPKPRRKPIGIIATKEELQRLKDYQKRRQ